MHRLHAETRLSISAKKGQKPPNNLLPNRNESISLRIAQHHSKRYVTNVLCFMRLLCTLAQRSVKAKIHYTSFPQQVRSATIVGNFPVYEELEEVTEKRNFWAALSYNKTFICTSFHLSHFYINVHFYNFLLYHVTSCHLIWLHYHAK